MKDTITLQDRTFDCTKLVQQRFGLDPQTLRKWAKHNIIPAPLRLGNKCFYDRDAVENRLLGGESRQSGDDITMLELK